METSPAAARPGPGSGGGIALESPKPYKISQKLMLSGADAENIQKYVIRGHEMHADAAVKEEETIERLLVARCRGQVNGKRKMEEPYRGKMHTP